MFLRLDNARVECADYLLTVNIFHAVAVDQVVASSRLTPLISPVSTSHPVRL